MFIKSSMALAFLSAFSRSSYANKGLTGVVAIAGTATLLKKETHKRAPMNLLLPDLGHVVWPLLSILLIIGIGVLLFKIMRMLSGKNKR